MEAALQNIHKLDKILQGFEKEMNKNVDSNLYSFLVVQLTNYIRSRRALLLNNGADTKEHKVYTFMVSVGEYGEYDSQVSVVILVPYETPSLRELEIKFAEWRKKDHASLAEHFAKDGVKTLNKNGEFTRAFQGMLGQVNMTGRYDFAAWVARNYYGKYLHFESTHSY